MSDPRTLRTRSSLQRAVVELASAQDPSSVTVASLTQTAGINRATFYDHYDSPQEVLLEVLRDDLDRTRQHDLELRDAVNGPHGGNFRVTMSEVLDHVRRFLPVYEQSVRSPVDSTLTRAVSSHFVESIRGILARQDALPKGVDAEIAAACIGNAVLGGIGVWLHRQDLSDAEFADAVAACLPAWWHELR
ncbi:TetR/AcrR family transcriptional regulator [Gulosibacter sediminis]|uniref:TetR/AcrR family transcriptional regulator n=1 Tax=Gulosibacter sediminis TaxID=1729695 RepID=UPI0018673A92|nr:TetR/AcrR family transcriptional regulator [Gulosibacter sediminis]